jgi:high affinity Mn2+ porin
MDDTLLSVGARLPGLFCLKSLKPITLAACFFAAALSLQAAFADPPASDRVADDATGSSGDPSQAAAEAAQFHQFEFHAQGTWIFQEKPAFGAAYSGPESLQTRAETSFTLSATGYFAAHLWQGGEFYLDAELFRGQPFSNLLGFGGFPNGELQKGIGHDLADYIPRAFWRQTFGFGGGSEEKQSDQHQLGETLDHNRLVLTAGKLAVTDLFDNNQFSHDPRSQFMNWASYDYGSYDFAADIRGYSWGAAAELDEGDWAMRAGRFLMPRLPDGNQLNYSIMNYHGDQIEVDHSHVLFGEPGKIRVMMFLNRSIMGSFNDALTYAAENHSIPSVATVRKPQDKRGYGINGEQNLTDDIGVFVRLGWADGQTETYSFAEIEQTDQIGLSIKGTRWRRADDTFGIVYVQNGLSTAHQHYLADGGLGVFIGDGALSYHTEDIVETYYSIAINKYLSLSLDYQHIANPAYNSARGPVSVYGTRLHAEY